MTTPLLSLPTEAAVSPALAAALPRVNLLPPEIVERQRFRKVQAGLGAGLGVVAALVIAAYGVTAGSVSDARQDLAVATAEGARLQTEQQAYADAPAVQAKLKSEKALLAAAMGQDVRWSQYLRDIALLMPNGVWLTDVSVVQAGAGAGASDAAGQGVASIVFSGKATSQNAVAGWLDALATEPGFSDPFFTNSTSALDPQLGRTVVTFSSTVTVTSEALSHRYDSTGS
ncbi:PilN domain-containing protein [Motilibacter deserti]|uniref:Type IV pilus assembly protein PilN n=1 Tax=Motilibacter deserti TaxID=2714956 RepID=A0ABX0GWM6_9ACTN|nr:PilN domain-containing protein [Motilibacter deserti]NHC14012.1 hypothetical protein [Motilibacter deserti]